MPDAVLRAIAEHTISAIVVVNGAGRIVLVNDQTERLFGHTRDRLLGQPIETLVPEGFAQAHERHRQSYTRQPQPRPMGIGREPEARRHDGSTFPVDVSLTPLSTETGDTVIAIVRDIGDRVALAQERAEMARLRDVLTLHRDLTTAASSGQGLLGIAGALQRAIQRPVTIEDPDGTVLCSTDGAGPGHVPATERARRQRLTDAGHAFAFRDGPSLVAVARPDSQVLGAITLFDPDGETGDLEARALEQAATVLAIELFRLRSVAETELAVWGDLTSELLDDGNVERSRSHALVLGYHVDHRPHRAVLVERIGPRVGDLLPAVRRAARRFGVTTGLMTSRAAGVVLLLDHDLPWEEFAGAVAEENGGVHRIGLGGLHVAGDFGRSLSEAHTALELTERLGRGDAVAVFDDLGVWRLLAADGDPTNLARFVRQWIGALVDYDTSRNADLVATLTAYLENAGAHEATAARLFIHRSTLRYRLSRIATLTGWDLGDPEQRFNLDLACRAWFTLNASVHAPVAEAAAPGVLSSGDESEP